MSVVKILDLVGKRTKTKFRNAEVKRVISVDELSKTFENDKEYNIVVVEAVRQNETAKLKEFITCNNDCHILFYIEDVNEIITSGVADEMDLDIYMTLDEVYSKVKDITGVRVSARLDDIKRNTEEPEGFASLEGTILGINNEETPEEQEETAEQEGAEEESIEENEASDGIESEDITEDETTEEVKGEAEWEVEDNIDEVEGSTGEAEDSTDEVEYDTDVAYEGTEEKVEKTWSSIEGTEEKQQEDNEKVSELLNDIQKANERIAELEKLLLMCKQEKRDIQSIIENIEEETMIENPVDGYRLEEANKRIEELENIRENLEKDIEKAVLSSEGTVKELEETKQRLEETEVENRSLAETVRDITNKNDNSDKKIVEALETEKQLRDRIVELETEILNTKTELDKNVKKLAETEVEKGNLIEKLSSTNAENMDNNLLVTKLKKENEILSEKLEEASKNVASSSAEELEELNSKLEIYQGKIDELVKENTALEIQIKNAEEQRQEVEYSSEAVKPFNYTGKATIIPVFGTGGSGTTTTVMSIAQKLKKGKRVVVVDMDFLYPNVDIWLKTSPSVDYGRGLSPVDSTSLGLFIKRGFEEFKATRDSIKKYETTSIGCLDFIGNTINFFEEAEIVNGEYSKLLEYLGVQYDYVIIDHGTLGCSPVKDSVISAIVNSCGNGILVSSNNLRRIRVADLAVAKANIDRGNITWLLNMCTTTSIVGRATEVVDKYRNYMMIPYYQQIANNGNRKGFLEAVPSSEILAELVESIEKRGR